VLLVGVPHPNEPIGTLTAEFLSRLMCENDALREISASRSTSSRSPIPTASS
jgi:hypothetical protein